MKNLTTTHKIVIAVLIVALIGLGVYLYNKNRSGQNGGGLFNKPLTNEQQAIELSKQAANYLELETEEGTAMFYDLKQQINALGYNYIGYGQVEKIPGT